IGTDPLRRAAHHRRDSRQRVAGRARRLGDDDADPASLARRAEDARPGHTDQGAGVELDRASLRRSAHHVLAARGDVQRGDGDRGRVPGLDARIVAVRYRYGGGQSSELAVATVTQGENLPPGIQDVTNPVPARGGRDAETLDEAKRRAPRELRTLGRAVTA